METVASMKLRSFKMRKSITGCFWRNSQNTTATRQTTVMMANATMKWEANQSSRWPSSSTTSSAPSPRASRPRPM